jgi:hypothetical protein
MQHTKFADMRLNTLLSELPAVEEYPQHAEDPEETDSAALNFFFKVVPDVSREELIHLLESVWEEDPTTALRLIFQTGNVRQLDGGKMDRDNFYRCLLWLWQRYPETLLLNLTAIPEHTCLKDLLSLLVFAMNDDQVGEPTLESSLVGKRLATQHRMHIRTKQAKRQRRADRDDRRASLKQAFAASLQQPLDALLKVAPADDPHKVLWESAQIKEKWLAFVRARDLGLKAEAAEHSQQRERKCKLDVRLRLHAVDTNLGKLFASVVDIFARGLCDELETLREDPLALAGLYGKWAPSVGGAHDKATAIVDAIAVKVLVGPLADARYGQLPEEEAKAARRVAYTRLVLSPLRAAAKIPEHFVGKADWAGVDYDRMPSRCRLLFGERVFAKHDKQRYRAFLDEAQAAALAEKRQPDAHVKSVKVGALLPHEVTERGWNAWLSIQTADEEKGCLDHERMVNQEANLQWRGIVEGCKQAARQGDGVGCWVPVCDVSGSMTGEPMAVAIALSLLLAQVNQPDTGWYGKMFTFDTVPELVTVVKHNTEKLVDVGELVHRTRVMGWGGSTNIDLTMDLFLAHTIANGTAAATLAQQAVVIFSDMEFDQADNAQEPWETTHKAITAKFNDAGYTRAPLIVYWNLRASQSTPVQIQATPGVLLLAGFSAGLLRSFLAGKLEEFTPAAQLRSVLGLKAYAGLVVAMTDC